MEAGKNEQEFSISRLKSEQRPEAEERSRSMGSGGHEMGKGELRGGEGYPGRLRAEGPSSTTLLTARVLEGHNHQALGMFLRGYTSYVGL